MLAGWPTIFGWLANYAEVVMRPSVRCVTHGDADLPEPLRPLLDKVATTSAQVTDEDFATALAAGSTEDELFELVICAAVGQSARQYEAGLAALAQAIADEESR